MTHRNRNLLWVLATVFAFCANVYIDTQNFLSFVFVCVSLFLGLVLAVDPDESIPIKVFRMRVGMVMGSLIFCFLAPRMLVGVTASVCLMAWIGQALLDLKHKNDELNSLLNEDGFEPPEFR